MKIFALKSSADFGERVAADLGVPLSALEEREFEDGEHKVRALESVRNEDVYVIQSLYADTTQSVHDKLCRLLFLIGALKDAAARRVTAVIPYLCYARKDRKTKARDPVTTRYVANLIESVGTDRVVTMDVHNLAAFQNAFRCRTEHLEAKRLFVDYFGRILEGIEGQSVTVVSPDIGGVKRARAFRDALEQALGRSIDMAFMEKHRSGGVVQGEAVVGSVEGAVVIIIDDLISTGTTIVRAADACRLLGAKEVHAAASHGVFVGASETLAGRDLEKIIVTDSIPPIRLDSKLVEEKLVILEGSWLFAQAIRRMHFGDSVVELVEHGSGGVPG